MLAIQLDKALKFILYFLWQYQRKFFLWCIHRRKCHGRHVRIKYWVFMFYSGWMPSALSLFDKIVYLFSTCEDDLDLELEEKRVKTYLENYIMTFHSTKLRKLLLRWCQSDCLNTSHVYVRFSKSDICQRPVFDPDVSTEMFEVNPIFYIALNVVHS
jgi:hypothetical protein